MENQAPDHLASSEYLFPEQKRQPPPLIKQHSILSLIAF